jgi:hypothetical protein
MKTKSKTIKTKLEMTYNERAMQLEHKADKALLAGIARDWSAVEAAAQSAGKQTIIGINKMRACGEKLKQLAGHEQINADFFQSVTLSLPASMSYTGARGAVHISNRIEKDVKTVQEAVAVQKELFAAVGDFKEPKRLVEQTAHESNHWDSFVSIGQSFSNLLTELEKSATMEKWEREKLERFVATTKPISDKHNAAVELLK